MSLPSRLPEGIHVFERGWLSSNNILFTGDGPSALVDSGYCTHARQTVDLVERQLGGRALDLLANTHLHSDHCGGNAALQQRFPHLQTWIPPGHADAVREWDLDALTFRPTGQECPRFSFNALLQPGTTIRLGGCNWEVHGAPGHDPHSVLLFEPSARILISADSLWLNGFGVVFPELEGENAFDDVGSTLDLIETLNPALVIPGHGPLFDDVSGALVRARHRLDSFVQAPGRHARYAAKVLLKFKLLQVQVFPLNDVRSWAMNARYLQLLHHNHEHPQSFDQWLDGLLAELVKSGAARLEGDQLMDA